MRGTVQAPAKGAEQRAPLYRWVVYGLLVLCYFLANFHRLATGVMQEELTAVFGLTAASFGNLGSMVFYPGLRRCAERRDLDPGLGRHEACCQGGRLSGAHHGCDLDRPDEYQQLWQRHRADRPLRVHAHRCRRRLHRRRREDCHHAGHLPRCVLQ